MHMTKRIVLILSMSILLILSVCNCQKYEEIGLTKEADMKAIGLIGGMSWLSTAEYYRIINQVYPPIQI